MSVQAPLRPPDQAELDDALIEEARRRARRRRLGYVVVVLGLAIVVGAGVYAGFADHGGGGAGSHGGLSSGGGTRSFGTLFLEGPARGSLDRLVALDLHTGRARTLPIEVSCGDAVDCLVPSGGELVIGSPSNTGVYDPSRPGPPRRRRIGNGWTIVPSPTHGRVWLALRDRRKKARATWPALKLRAVREETVSGRVIRSAHAPGLDWWPGGPGHFPEGAVEAGLVFVTDTGLRVWSPRAGAVTVRAPGRAPFVVDTHGNLIAWCSAYCPRFRITNGRTGETRRVTPPAGYSFQPGYDGAFSPDDSLLALPVVPAREAERRNHKLPNDARWSMALVDVKAGTARIVRDSRLDPIYHAMAWSASGGQLFFSAGGGRIMAYVPGSPKATILARVNGTIFHMAAL